MECKNVRNADRKRALFRGMLSLTKKKAPSSPCNPEKGFEEQAVQLTFKQLN